MISGCFSLLFRLILLAVVSFIGMGIWIVYDGLNDKGGRAEIAVVLGHAVRTDGTPGRLLQVRLDRALDLYRAGEFPLIVVSGARHGDHYDEATGMARYLEAHGVPASAIIEDHEGFNTAATAYNLAAIMRKRDLHSVMIVTHYYHITRTKLALRMMGIPGAQQMHAGVVQQGDWYNLCREIVGTYYYFFKLGLIPLEKKIEETVHTRSH